MTPAERVGQLFIVSFHGAEVAPDSEIYKLVVNYHIGGVVLQAQNENFSAAAGLPEKTQALTNAIQSLEWNSSTMLVESPEKSVQTKPTYIPLFIGLTQDGNGYPNDQILNGLTPLPSQMAIGATWNPDLAKRAGEIRGRELSALGFNLYLGPSLDALENPSPAGGDLDTRVFGGDPFWVGEMGRAYIAGLHGGSSGRMFVVAKHFPGVGASDRLPDDEISTVRKSIEQLKQLELAPFFAATGGAPDSKADGLLVFHIRFQGFQGNIRATTRPVSFDPQALAQLTALPQLAQWREEGGLLVSGDLSSPAVREFYALGGGQFSARNAARDAFIAGNDVLYLGNIVSAESQDTFSSTVKVIEFFKQKYLEDPAFAQRVDTAVARILAAKLKLYGGNFLPDRALVPAWRLENAGTEGDVAFEIARSAATLVSPDLQELPNALPLPPQANERVVFLTDTQTVKQCAACPEQSAFPADALEQNVLRLYGPQSGGLASDARMTSYSFQTLQALLENQNPEGIAADLMRASWVVISLRNASRGQPALVSRFLRERPELLRNKRLIVFSFGAPYYFDATTISKFTAYYALYSQQPQFVDVAARLLFQELTPPGFSPVSIPGAGYDLIRVTSPDPNQIIPLMLDLEAAPAPTEGALTPQPTPVPLFRIGDTIAVRTGIIKDHNGHVVPDGTVAQFSVLLTGEGGGVIKQSETTTVKGVARMTFGLDKPGLLEIRVASEPATVSEALQLDVSQSGAAAVTVIAPEATFPAEPSPTPAAEEKENPYVSQQGYPLFSSWFLYMLFMVFGMWIAYGFGARLRGMRAALRWALGIALGGLVSYNLLAFGAFGVNEWILARGFSGVLAFTFIGELLGFIGGLIWARRA